MGRSFFKSRTLALTIVVCASLIISSCNNISNLLGKDKEEEEKQQTMQLLLLLGAAYFSNPCNFAPSPVLASAQASGSMTGFGSIKGKFLTQSGAAVVSALVIAESNAGVGTTFWSTHSSINRDGSFFISGINPATVRVAIEPIYSDYYGRIDTQIDCYRSPSTFTVGWISASGTIVTARASGMDIVVGAGSTVDVGTVRILN